MQFIARLHTPRQDVNQLQTSTYGASAGLLGRQALLTLASEPVGAWVAVIERIEVTRREYRKELDANGKEVIRTVFSHTAEGLGQEPSSQIDAGKK